MKFQLFVYSPLNDQIALFKEFIAKSAGAVEYTDCL